MNSRKRSKSGVRVTQCNGMQSHYRTMCKESKWFTSLCGVVQTSHIGSQKLFWRRLQNSSSSWTIGQERCSLHSRHILMWMGNRLMQGIWYQWEWWIDWHTGLDMKQKGWSFLQRRKSTARGQIILSIYGGNITSVSVIHLYLLRLTCPQL